jgi:iron complex transport system ATP-binding protein
MIELRGVWFSYNGRAASVLSDVSVSIRSGAVTALLGPNGSGKTTLLNLLLGWLKPGEGEIRISGRTVGTLSGRDRSRLIGHVAPDEPAVLELDVREYVFLGRTPYLGLSGRPEPDDLQAVESALEIVDLLSKAGRPVRTLSTGERQLAAVARALAQDRASRPGQHPARPRTLGPPPVPREDDCPNDARSKHRLRAGR